MTMIEDLDLTALPLDDFRKVVGIDPWHFWQMSTPDGCSSASCKPKGRQPESETGELVL